MVQLTSFTAVYAQVVSIRKDPPLKLLPKYALSRRIGPIGFALALYDSINKFTLKERAVSLQ